MAGDTDDLPEWWDDVERVEVLHRRIGATVDPDRDLPGHVEETRTPGLTHNKAVAFGEGDDLPLDIAEGVWSAFADRLAAFDADGERLDTPHRNEDSGFSTVAHTI